MQFTGMEHIAKDGVSGRAAAAFAMSALASYVTFTYRYSYRYL